MNWIDNTVSDFGRNILIDQLQFNRQNLICLDFESSGRLYIEKAMDQVMIYLVKKLPSYETINFRELLKRCHYREGLPVNVNIGYREENQLVFLTRIPEKDFTLPSLERVIDLLMKLS